MPRCTLPPRRLPKPLAALHGNEEPAWLCHSLDGGAPFIVVQGWTGLVRRLAMECIDVAASPTALRQAEAWLLDDGAWHFGQDGSASWRIALPEGAWAATLMTEGRSLDQAKQALLG